MQKETNQYDTNTISEISISLEEILERIENFTTGDSIYGTMKSSKRGRGEQEPGRSPESSSPPKKTGRTTRLLRSGTKTPKKTTKPSTTKRTTRCSTPTPPMPRPTDDQVSTPLTSTPATSLSNITESFASEAEQPNPEKSLDATVIYNPGPSNPQQPAITPSLSGPHKYTVELGFIQYITGQSPSRPREYNQTIRLWFQDLWNNLENPPDSLTSSMFLICLPHSMGNAEKLRMMMIASNNLEVARLSNRFVSKDPELFTKGFKEWLHFANICDPATREPDKPQTTLLQDQFLQVTKELLDTVKVLQKDIDRNAFLFRSVCVDTAQGLREGGERMIRDVKAITGLVATSTTSLSVPTRDKATVIPPPPPPSRPQPPGVPKKKGPSSATYKSKK